MPVRFIPEDDPNETSVSITCPDCGRTSWHPDDVANGYCGACHAFTSEPVVTYADNIVING